MPLSFGQFSALIGAIYQGPLETVPWGSALVMLREIMRANWATLILRPASADQSALVIRASERGHEVYNAAYSHFQTFSMDPFVGLPVQCVVTIDEMIDSSWMTGDFYKAFLEPNDIRYIMGADIVTEDGADCRLRITRPLGGQNFSEKEKALCQELLPHLKRAVTLHSRIDRIETERLLYSTTIDRMLLGTVVFDENGSVMRTNRVADALLVEKDGIRMVQNALQAEFPAENKGLQRLIKLALAAPGAAVPAVPEAMSLTRRSGRASLGVLVRPVPLGEWSEGRHRPTAIAFIRDPERKSQLSQEIIKNLFGLTGAEATLALLLAKGLTLDEAAAELKIRKNTTRAHLRSIFAKTGVRRQTTLVHLLLSSVASIS
ncbi:MAG: helix-turn-helix transcriptional regulator [Steroidobacteraceae bacterium]|nr:helix-turn-helix transcriptional regulator [Steroidobacteraceae bacterium]